MIDVSLVKGKIVATCKGDGPAVDIGHATNRVFLVTLAITKIIEQESLDISIFGSPDGATWGAKSIAAFPQKFYCGDWPLLLDLTAHPDVKFVRPHWEVARWGRGTETPMFEFGVQTQRSPAQHPQRGHGRSQRPWHSSQARALVKVRVPHFSRPLREVGSLPAPHPLILITA